MSESFESVLGRVNYAKYIKQIQDELSHIQPSVPTGKNGPDPAVFLERLQSLFRTQTKELAKEVGLTGSPVMVYMIATSILATAWVAFALRREASDLSKSPEDRLGTIQVLDSLGLALDRVIDSASSYADAYPSASSMAAEEESGSQG